MFNSKEHIERVTMACQIQLKAHSNGEKMSMNEAFERAKSEQPRQNVILSAEQYQEYRKANPSEEQWHNTFGWWVLGLITFALFVYLLTHFGGGEPSDYGFILPLFS